MFKGELIENRIVIWDLEEARALFSKGFYGKPLGIPKPKGADFNAPLVIDLIEGFFLVQEKVLEVRDPVTSKRVPLRRIKEICSQEYSRFDERYLVYRELRRAGYVVTPGIKFGCDFAVYEHGPGIDHAPFLVQVVEPDDAITATAVVLSGRLATTVRKQFILAIPDLKRRRVDFVAFDWWRA